MLLSLLSTLAHAADEQHADFSAMGIWNASGPIAKGVVVTLLLMGLVCLFVSIERLWAFRSAVNQSEAVGAAVVPKLMANDVAGALAVTKQDDYKNSYLAALLRAGLAELAENPDEFGVNSAHRLVDKAVGLELSKLKKNLALLATTASTGPFVGLFGTTTGVINSFAQMSGGGAGLASVSAGISEALITTAIGILVAVIAVWLYNYFNQRIEKVTEELVSSTADFFDWADKFVAKRGAAPAAAAEGGN